MPFKSHPKNVKKGKKFVYGKNFWASPKNLVRCKVIEIKGFEEKKNGQKM